MSPVVDKFASWLLAGIGATAALTITNLKSITSIISFENIKLGLVFLIISALFGFLEKFLALDIQATTSQESKLRNILQDSSAKYSEKFHCNVKFAKSNNIDLNEIVEVVKVLHKFKDAHPWYKRWQLSKNLNAADALKARLRRYYRQVAYTIFEFIGFLLFIIIAILSI